jgi:hypothetical protein
MFFLSIQGVIVFHAHVSLKCKDSICRCLQIGHPAFLSGHVIKMFGLAQQIMQAGVIAKPCLLKLQIQKQQFLQVTAICHLPDIGGSDNLGEQAVRLSGKSIESNQSRIGAVHQVLIGTAKPGGKSRLAGNAA